MSLHIFKLNKCLMHSNTKISSFIKTLNVCNRHFSAIQRNHENNKVLLNRVLVGCEPCVNPCDRRNFIGYVPDKKEDYKTMKDETQLEHMKFGLKQLKNEVKMWTEEWKEILRNDPLIILPYGKYTHI